jgi:hypothetical protein
MTLPRKPMHALRCFDRFATDKLWITRWTLMGKASDSITLKNLQLVRLIKVRVLTTGLDLWYDDRCKGFEESKVLLATE